jgi:hypothetical protein
MTVRVVELDELYSSRKDEPIKRYELVIHDEVLLKLDTSSDQYSAEWPTDRSLGDFKRLLSDYIGELDNANAQADFGLREDQTRLEEGTFSSITSKPEYPEKCTFILIKFGPVEISWAKSEDEKNNILNYTMFGDDVTIFKGFYRDSAKIPNVVGRASDGTEEDDVLEEATAIINKNIED